MQNIRKDGMSQETTKKTKLTPPYLSMAKLSQIVNLISSRNFSELGPSDLGHYGFGESDAYAAVGALRFLGLIDGSNKVQESAKKLHLQGASRTEALAAITKSAYAELFDRVPNLLDLSTDDLHNELLITYGITPRIAKSALPAFLWLCEQGGLKEPSPESIKRTPQKGSGPKAVSKPATEKNVDTKAIPPRFDQGVLNFSFKGGIQLLVPNNGPEITAAIAQGELKTISDQINEFSRNYLLNKEQENHE